MPSVESIIREPITVSTVAMPRPSVESITTREPILTISRGIHRFKFWLRRELTPDAGAGADVDPESGSDSMQYHVIVDDDFGLHVLDGYVKIRSLDERYDPIVGFALGRFHFNDDTIEGAVFDEVLPGSSAYLARIYGLWHLDDVEPAQIMAFNAVMYQLKRRVVAQWSMSPEAPFDIRIEAQGSRLFENEIQNLVAGFARTGLLSRLLPDFNKLRAIGDYHTKIHVSVDLSARCSVGTDQASIRAVFTPLP